MGAIQGDTRILDKGWSCERRFSLWGSGMGYLGYLGFRVLGF